MMKINYGVTITTRFTWVACCDKKWCSHLMTRLIYLINVWAGTYRRLGRSSQMI